jgi:dissimilatory sulfite reductase (desulfoviridin) alpha/beta subunit
MMIITNIYMAFICSQCFTCVNSSNPYHNPMREVRIIISNRIIEKQYSSVTYNLIVIHNAYDVMLMTVHNICTTYNSNGDNRLHFSDT